MTDEVNTLLEQLKVSDIREKLGLLLEILKHKRSLSLEKEIELILQAQNSAERFGKPEEVVEALLMAADYYDRTGAYLKVSEICRKILSISEKEGYLKGSAKANNCLGINYVRQGLYAEALKYFEATEEVLNKLGDKKLKEIALINKGAIYASKGSFKKDLHSFFDALSISEEFKNEEGRAKCLINIGTIYLEQLSYGQALGYFTEAYQISEQLQSTELMAFISNNIGDIHYKKGAFGQALLDYQKALEKYDKLGAKKGIATSIINIGKISSTQKKYPQALNSFFKSLDIFEESGDKYGIALSCMSIAENYMAIKNWDKAGTYLYRSYELAKNLDHKTLTRDILFVLSTYYEEIGRLSEALDFYKKYHLISIELQAEEAESNLEKLNFRRELDLAERENKLEKEKSLALKIERDRSDKLLKNILPEEVAEELKQEGKYEARLFPDVTVIFSDFKDFTLFSEANGAEKTVRELDVCFKKFDEIMDKYGIEKIKTIGDAYLACAGLPLANINHAENAVGAAIEMRDFIKSRKAQLGSNSFDVRIGINSGSVIAGIVGWKKYAYDIWGDTVNTAARMEQNSIAGKINLSQNTYELVNKKYQCLYRGEIEAKNKGKLKMYFLD